MDATLVWHVNENSSYGDLQLLGQDLATGNDLQNAVLISLFSDKRAVETTELPVGEVNRRGWWGDTEAQKIGSLLWLLKREKTTQQTADRIRQYAQEALQWLLTQEVAERLEVTTTIENNSKIALNIKLIRGKAKKWGHVWEEPPLTNKHIKTGWGAIILTLK